MLTKNKKLIIRCDCCDCLARFKDSGNASLFKLKIDSNQVVFRILGKILRYKMNWF